MIAIYPGSFDPITNGHLDIIRRSAAICDKLIIGLLINPRKKSLFTTDERMAHLRKVTAGLANAEAKYFSGFLTDFALANSADFIIRGLRSNVIAEYEMQVAVARTAVETLFMFSRPEYMHISSTMVREVVLGGGDATGMVPDCVIPDILSLQRQNG